MPADDAHRPDRVPEALETLIARLGELHVVFGDAARRTLAAVEQDLRRAVAARDRGDPVESIERIGLGMDRLARLADGLGGGAGVTMRLVIDRFRTALVHGHTSDAQRATDIMREMSGAEPTDDDH